MNDNGSLQPQPDPQEDTLAGQVVPGQMPTGLKPASENVQEQSSQNQPQASVKKRGKGLGIAAMVLGIVAAVCAFIPVVNVFGFVVAFVGLALGIISLVLARGGKGAKAFGIVGVVTSLVAIAITIVMYLLLYSFLVDIGAIETIERAFPTEATSEDFKVVSIEFDEENSTEKFFRYKGILECSSSIQFLGLLIELPIYDETGVQVDTARGNAHFLDSGELEFTAVIFAREGETLTFNKDELVIIPW